MHLKNTILSLILTLLLCTATFAQTLTVRDIMAEPSIAGMRPDSERLSPDGRWVIFSWNAEGKEPRDLYITSVSGGAPRILVKAEDNFDKRNEPPASKLNYGLIVRDDFVKAREKNLFGVEFSPDSKRILFLQNSDIFILDLTSDSDITTREAQNRDAKWQLYRAAMLRRVDLLLKLVEALRRTGINEPELFNQIENETNNLLSLLKDAESALTSDEKVNRAITVNDRLSKLTVNVTEDLLKSYPQLKKNDPYLLVLDELLGTENRLKVARMDYNEVIKSIVPLQKPKRLTKTQAPENRAFWLDDNRIAFQTGGNFFSLNITDGTLIQLTKEANPQAFITIGASNRNEKGSMLAYVVSDGSKQRALVVPNYLDEFVTAQPTRRGWSDQKVYAVPTDGSRETPFEVKLPKPEGTCYIRSVKWAADDASLVIDRVDKDTKRRQLFFVHNVGSKAEQIITVTEETDEKWVAGLSRIVEPSPTETGKIIFGSERDGYNHLYLATLEPAKPQPNPTGEPRQENPSATGFTGKVEIKQLTKGNFEVDFAKWRKERQEVVFSSTEANTAEREFYVVDPGTAAKSPVPSDLKGMKTNAQMVSTDSQTTLIFQGSGWNQPTDIYAQRICPECRGLNTEHPLTRSTPVAFTKISWSEPKFIDIPSRDGKQIKSKVYLPANFAQDRAKNAFPMVIFVHGAGYLQNTINGWNNYFREFMFHTILTKRGYIVLDIDYRGSAGYGRDWRTDVYDFLGGKDYDDHLDAIDYMVKNYNVNPAKVGAYGGSYGGFMAEMLIMRAPDKMAAAAALRPVADWKNYYASSPIYTAERLGFPDKNPEAYKRSSPISYADKLQKPLLILHGMSDDNVHVQDSIQLIEKLIRLGKTPYFEAMLYPSENHGFVRPESWADEYERILNFFEKHLKN